jgi:hypothetical protein
MTATQEIHFDHDLKTSFKFHSQVGTLLKAAVLNVRALIHAQTLCIIKTSDIFFKSQEKNLILLFVFTHF